MGANATGKTELGRLLMSMFNFIDSKEYSGFVKLIEDCNGDRYKDSDEALRVNYRGSSQICRNLLKSKTGIYKTTRGEQSMFDREKLNKVNQILNSKYTFEFSDISKDTTEGVLILSIIQARIIAEGICRYVVLYKQIVKNENSIRTATLEVFLTKLNLSMVVEPKVRESLRSIQGWSNTAAHYQVGGALGFDAVQLCIQALELVISWFIDEYDGTSLSDIDENAELSTDRMGMIPEMVEGCVISREDDALAVWKILNQNSVIQLHGDSGTGKTEFCKEYAKKYKKRYDSVYYAENVSSFDQFVSDLPFRIENKLTKTHEQIFREKLNLFKQLNERHLFILDNYMGQDYSWLTRLINDVRCHIIITGTEIIPFDNVQSMVLKTPSVSESIKLFEYFDPIPMERMELEEIIESLGRNLRLVKMCAVFLYSRQNRTDFRELINSIGLKKDNINNVLKKTCSLILDSKSMDEKSQKVLGLVSLLPYSGVPFDVLVKWCKIACNGEDMRETLERLLHSQWFSLDDNSCMVISQTISDVLFEELRVDPYAEASVRLLKPIFDIIRDFLNLTDDEIRIVNPYASHFTNRIFLRDIILINDIEKRNRRRTVLTILRDYYTAIYNLSYAIPLFEKIHEVIRLEENDRFIDEEHTIYKEGETYLKLERFDEACSKFDSSLKKLDEKIVRIKRNTAMISAQYAHALAYAGQCEKALTVGEYSIRLRKEVDPKAVWISYYNYALALYKAGRLDEAMDCCEDTIRRFLEIYNEKEKGFYYNFSSPLHLRGQIYLAMNNTEAAIRDLEESARIRKERNGENTYWMAQIYGYLSEAYEKAGKKDRALQYALRSKEIREKFYKGDQKTVQIEELEKRIRSISIEMIEVKSEKISIRNNKRNDKPNEDMIYANDNTGVYIVLDGVSRDTENGLYPNPSPAVIATERFLQYCVKWIEKELVPDDQDPKEFLRKIIRKANQELGEYNQMLGHRFPAGTVGIVSFIWGQFLYYAYIGDCTGILIREGSQFPFTIKQTNEVMRHKKEFTSDEIRFQICNHIDHSCGYGVWDGNDAAMDFVVIGCIPICDGDIIVLHSDGADDLIDKMTIKRIIEDSVETVLDQYCSHTKNQDDLSIVKITFGKHEK